MAHQNDHNNAYYLTEELDFYLYPNYFIRYGYLYTLHFAHTTTTLTIVKVN